MTSPCVHPIADQQIVGSIIQPRYRKPGLHVTAVTLRCRECGEHTTVTTPRKDRNGTDASHDTENTEASGAQR